MSIEKGAGPSAYMRPQNTMIMDDSDEGECAGSNAIAAGKQIPKPANIKSNTNVSGGKKQAGGKAPPNAAGGAAKNNTKPAQVAKVATPKAKKASDKKAPLSMKSPMLNSREENFSSLRPVRRQVVIANPPDSSQGSRSNNNGGKTPQKSDNCTGRCAVVDQVEGGSPQRSRV